MDGASPVGLSGGMPSPSTSTRLRAPGGVSLGPQETLGLVSSSTSLEAAAIKEDRGILSIGLSWSWSWTEGRQECGILVPHLERVGPVLCPGVRCIILVYVLLKRAWVGCTEAEKGRFSGWSGHCAPCQEVGDIHNPGSLGPWKLLLQEPHPHSAVSPCRQLQAHRICLLRVPSL